MSETTTIQVTEDVLEILKQVREEEGAPSYNATLRKMLLSRKESLAGCLGPKLSMKDILKDLRDEED
ncbi:MAG: hypothetical protein HY363_04400 [Candidatus Aenigmarchaeota archaeon]|nr:hypothetical protein [Candidatus Aenigmarchaeota archaeon]